MAPRRNTLADLAGGFAPPALPTTGLGSIGTLRAKTKRKAFFSFHFDDVMRVNVVRNAWKIALAATTESAT